MPHFEIEFELLDEDTLLPVEELARTCQVEVGWIEALAEQGVLQPVDVEARLFPALVIARLQRAQRLARDFELGAPGLALVLDLLDEIERLKRR